MSLLESEAAAGQAGDKIVMKYGWDPGYAEQLVEKSRQEHIEEMVPEDAGEKFTSMGRIERWRDTQFDKSSPLIAWLGNTATNDLIGAAWIENAHLKPGNGSRVFGVRVYEGYLQNGYGTQLTKAVHDAFDSTAKHSKVQYTMLRQNDGGFIMGLAAGYQLDERSGLYTQTYIRNKRT